MLGVTAYGFFLATFARKGRKHLALSLHTFAYRYLIQLLQIERFAVKLSVLCKGTEISAQGHLKDLCLYDENNDPLRAKVGLSRSVHSETVRHPNTLDGLNPIVKLLFNNFHIFNPHSGHEQTRCLLMQYYSILESRAVVRQTVRQCIRCRRLIQEIWQPQIPDLPCERFPSEHHFVFATTALEFICSLAW